MIHHWRWLSWDGPMLVSYKLSYWQLINCGIINEVVEGRQVLNLLQAVMAENAPFWRGAARCICYRLLPVEQVATSLSIRISSILYVLHREPSPSPLPQVPNLKFD